MKTLTRNGQDIDRLIPRELRIMFYRNPNPAHKYAKHNGYSPYGFTTDGLVLYLPLWALKGSSFKSVDAYGHTATSTNPVWRPYGRYFDGVDDKIVVPDNAALDLEYGLAVEIWVKPFDTTSDYMLLDKAGAASGVATNYRLHRRATNKLSLSYGNAASNDFRRFTTTDVLPSGWIHLIGIISAVATFVILVNGVSVAISADGGTAVDVGQNAGDVQIGERTDGAQDLKGDVGEARVYSTLSVAKGIHNYNTTKWRYQ